MEYYAGILLPLIETIPEEKYKTMKFNFMDDK